MKKLCISIAIHCSSKCRKHCISIALQNKEKITEQHSFQVGKMNGGRGIDIHHVSKDVVPKLEKGTGCNLTLNPHQRSADVDSYFHQFHYSDNFLWGGYWPLILLSTEKETVRHLPKVNFCHSLFPPFVGSPMICWCLMSCAWWGGEAAGITGDKSTGVVSDVLPTSTKHTENNRIGAMLS